MSRWSAPSSDTKLRGCRAARKIWLAFAMPTVLSVGECITSSARRRVRIRSVQVRRTYILDEVPPERQCLAADQERRLAFSEDAFDQGVVVVLDMGRLVRRADAHHGAYGVDQVGGGDDGGPAEGVPDEEPDSWPDPSMNLTA